VGAHLRQDGALSLYTKLSPGFGRGFCFGALILPRSAGIPKIFMLTHSAPAAQRVLGRFVSQRVLPSCITIAAILPRSGERMILREHEGEFWEKAGITIIQEALV